MKMRHRWIIMAVVSGLAVAAAYPQAPTESEKPPKEVVQQFYSLATEGRWLAPQHWDELQDFLTEVGPWYLPGAISVLQGYQVGDATRHIGYRDTVDYQVEVDCFEWGSIDSFLNFTRARGPSGKTSVAGEPVVRRTYETLFLTDKFVKSSPSGDKQETGALHWRMSLLTPPALNVDAALLWVAERRDKSSDPLIKYNADRTIAVLKSLSAGMLPPIQPAATVQEPPSEVAKQFIALESHSMPAQWEKVANFFVETPKPQWNHAIIVDIVGTGADTSGDSAEADVSTNSLGQLDSSMRLSNYPSMRLPLTIPSASACFGDDRFGFSLLLSSKHWKITKDGTVEEFEGPLVWRIEDTSFQPLITLDTAIRYVTQTRDKTADAVVKMNAAKTLRILEFYKEGKPLPDEFSSDAGGCS
jgi:hypothetical protein